jgi:hypothetical protein
VVGAGASSRTASARGWEQAEGALSDVRHRGGPCRVLASVNQAAGIRVRENVCNPCQKQLCVPNAAAAQFFMGHTHPQGLQPKGGCPMSTQEASGSMGHDPTPAGTPKKSHFPLFSLRYRLCAPCGLSKILRIF